MTIYTSHFCLIPNAKMIVYDNVVKQLVGGVYEFLSIFQLNW